MSSYYMFNKPRGCVTARKDALYPTVMDFFPEELRTTLHPVGRLDIDTEGMLLITDDGMFDHMLMEPAFHVEKEYFFWAFGNMNDDKASKLVAGIIIPGSSKPTLPSKFRVSEKKRVCDIESLLDINKREGYMKNPDGNVFSGYITLTEGRNHQVKLMLKAAGCTIAYLKRVSIGGIPLDEKLNPGEYRKLTENEINILYKGRDYEK